MNYLQQQTFSKIPEFSYMFTSPTSDAEMIDRLPKQIIEEYFKGKEEQGKINEDIKKAEEDETLKKLGLLKVSTDSQDRKTKMRDRLRKKLIDKYDL